MTSKTRKPAAGITPDGPERCVLSLLAQPEQCSPPVASLQGLIARTKAAQRPTFLLRLRPEPGNDDPIRSLRGLLKVALRRYRLRCTSAREIRGRK